MWVHRLRLIDSSVTLLLVLSPLSGPSDSPRFQSYQHRCRVPVGISPLKFPTFRPQSVPGDDAESKERNLTDWNKKLCTHSRAPRRCCLLEYINDIEGKPHIWGDRCHYIFCFKCISLLRDVLKYSIQEPNTNTVIYKCTPPNPHVCCHCCLTSEKICYHWESPGSLPEANFNFKYLLLLLLFLYWKNIIKHVYNIKTLHSTQQ